ncbi:MAG: hypothetical protein FJY76_04140 [Candidatus Aenigmarchaeota archaeon]|nr:hypothetical protein [Candidatus Aenigmarchaeota archaeon]
MEKLKFCPQCGKKLHKKDQKPYTFTDVPRITTGFDVGCRNCKWFGTIETQSGRDYKRFIEHLRSIEKNCKFVPLNDVMHELKMRKGLKRSSARHR